MYLAGANDKQNLNVDAIPALDDSVYIGLDTLASFAFEANFGSMSFEGLKKAKLDSLKEVISSQTTRYGFPDTIKAHEQVYIMNIIGQDTITNNRAIVQEGLSGRVAPGEVGYTSTIKPTQTVLHRQTGLQFIQPADDWLIKIAEHYAPKTSFYTLLLRDNFENLQIKKK